MKCAYHPHQAGLVYCTTCGRPLCVQCDHRVKGYPHCQDCIVRGIELLRLQRYTDTRRENGVKGGSPWRATLLGLIPGLGAVYNRQNAKAFLEFLGVVGFAELADFSGVGLLGAMAAFLYLYSLLDAFRTARAIRSGIDPSIEDERLRKILRENVKGWALVLVALGTLFLIGNLLHVVTARFVWRSILPLSLILLGLYLLGERWRRNASHRQFNEIIRDPSLSLSGPGRIGSGLDPSAGITDLRATPKRGG